MKNGSRASLEAYYREAGSWADDGVARANASRRTAWIIAAVASTIALAEAIAIVTLTPLKTVAPYTLLVDRQTGYVQALQPLEASQIAPTAALTQSFLAQYVIARESFDIAVLQANYRKVALWSSGSARARYLASMQANAPDSPLQRYPRSTIVETTIRSVSPLSAGSALVRFQTLRRDAGGRVGADMPYVSIVRYRYSGEPMSVEDRLVNPLGFQVVSYRRDQEAPPPDTPVAPTALSGPQGGRGEQAGFPTRP